MLRLGIDIGGSKIALAGCDGERTLFATRIALDDGRIPGEILAAVTSFLQNECGRHGLPDSLVIASAPNLDSDGRVGRWRNRPEWEGVQVVRSLAPFARRHILWCDDGTAATVADAWALGISNLIHFSLGTGVGGGICFEGRVLRDRELGHLLVHPDGLSCSCGRRGCLQAYASGRALEYFRQDGDIEAGTARWFAAASKALAACSSNLIELFGSTHITLSGGMAARFPSLAAAVEYALDSTYLKKPHVLPKVLLSPHGGDAPLQGALALSGATEGEQSAVCRRWAVS